MALQCRTCATVVFDTNTRNLFSEDNAKLLLNIELVCGTKVRISASFDDLSKFPFGLQLANDPKLPGSVCPGCIIDVSQAVAFRERCLQTQKELLSPEEISGFLGESLRIEEKQAPPEYGFDIADEDFLEPHCMDELESSNPVNKAAAFRERCIQTQQELLLLQSPVKEELQSAAELGDAFDEERSEASSEEFEQGEYDDPLMDPPPESPPPVPVKRPRGRPRGSSYKPKETHSKPKRSEKGKQEGPQERICELCGRQFVHANSFKLHMLMHSGVKAFPCTECDRSFYVDYQRAKHYRIVHQGQRPYTCRFCGKSFPACHNKAVHERIHTNTRPYKCRHCEKCFISGDKRKRHELIHTGVRAFSCTICAQTFQRNTHLKAHLRSKTHISKAQSLGLS
ncbi:hypothetical protein KR018_011801 [Drosophila ironensis]|nr:hypothetical protein KR018_011801 [Drosophila ironensis]